MNYTQACLDDRGTSIVSDHRSIGNANPRFVHRSADFQSAECRTTVVLCSSTALVVRDRSADCASVLRGNLNLGPAPFLSSSPEERIKVRSRSWRRLSTTNREMVFRSEFP